MKVSPASLSNSPILTCIFLTFIIAIFWGLPVYGLTVDDLTTDFSKNNEFQDERPTEASLKKIEESLFNGDIHFIKYGLRAFDENAEKLPAEVLALRAIVAIADKKYISGRALLADAEKKQKDHTYSLYAKAMLLRISNDYDNAEKTIQKALKVQNHPYALNILGRIQFDKNKYKEAISSFSQAIEMNENFVPAYLNLGSAYFQIGNFSKAREYFTIAGKLNPLEKRAYLGLAWAYEATNNYSEAIISLKKYIELAGERFDLLEYLAELQNKSGDYTGLSDTGKTLLNTDRNKGLLWQARADIYLKQIEKAQSKLDKTSIANAEKYYLQSLIHIIEEDFNKAKTTTQKALEKNSSYLAAQLADLTVELQLNQRMTIQPLAKKTPIYQYYAGLKAVKSTNQLQALDFFNQAENFVPGFSITGITASDLGKLVQPDNAKHIGLGTFYYLIKMPGQAQSHFQKALKTNPRSSFANYWLGQLSSEQGQLDKASEYFKTSISEKPFFPSLYSLAEISLKKSKPEDAIRYYRKALSLKSDPGILIKLGLLYESSGDNSAAEKTYIQLTEKHEHLFIGYNQLAWFYTKNNTKLDQAMDLAQKANGLQPGNSSILDTIGWLHHKKGEIDKAMRYLTEANQILANNPSILYHLGAVTIEKGNTEAGRKYINQALSLNPNFDEATAARKMLNSL